MQYTIYLLMMITIGWFLLLKLCGCLPSCGSPFLLPLSLHLHLHPSVSLSLSNTRCQCVSRVHAIFLSVTHTHTLCHVLKTHSLSLSIAFILTRKRGLSRSLLNHSSSTQSHSLSPSLSFPLPSQYFALKGRGSCHDYYVCVRR